MNSGIYEKSYKLANEEYALTSMSKNTVTQEIIKRAEERMLRASGGMVESVWRVHPRWAQAVRENKA